MAILLSQEGLEPFYAIAETKQYYIIINPHIFGYGQMNDTASVNFRQNRSLREEKQNNFRFRKVLTTYLQIKTMIMWKHMAFYVPLFG